MNNMRQPTPAPTPTRTIKPAPVKKPTSNFNFAKEYVKEFGKQTKKVLGTGAYEVSGAGSFMRGVRGARKDGLDLGDVGNIALGLGQGALFAIPGGGGVLAAGKAAASAAKAANVGKLIPRVSAMTKASKPTTYIPALSKNTVQGLTTKQGLKQIAQRTLPITAAVAGISALAGQPKQTVKTTTSTPTTTSPSLITIQPNISGPSLPRRTYPNAPKTTTTPPTGFGNQNLPAPSATVPIKPRDIRNIVDQTRGTNVETTTGGELRTLPPQTEKIPISLPRYTTPNVSEEITSPIPGTTYSTVTPQRTIQQPYQYTYEQQQYQSPQLETTQETTQAVSTPVEQGYPDFARIAAMRYQSGLARSAAQGAVRERDLRDLFTQKQMAARGRAAGTVGGRSQAILGSALTGTQRFLSAGMEKEALQKLDEQRALQDSYNEYLQEAYLRASEEERQKALARADMLSQLQRIGY